MFCKFEMMPRYKAIIEYCGTKYCGMQRQKDCSNTIQEVIEKAISKFANTKIEIDYSGRTDTGVHALGQVIHFDLPEERKEYNIVQGINFYLIDEDIVVLSVRKVDNDFHSRFSAKMRCYKYIVLNRKMTSPLLKDRVFCYPYEVDIKKIIEASSELVGKKMDFSVFCKKESLENVNTLKTINKIEIKREGEKIIFYFEAKSFLHNMIRILVGSLLAVGRGKITKDDLLKMIEQKNRLDICETAPACGLYFLETRY